MKVYLVSLCSIVLLFSSCVSSKKYKSLEASRNALQQKLNECNRTLANVQTNSRKEIDSLNKTIGSLREDTTRIGSGLREQIIRYNDCEKALADAKEQLNTATNNYNQLKSKSSKEIQGLIASLEQLQSDLLAREQRLREAERKLKERDSLVNAIQKSISDALMGFKESGLTVSIKNGNVYVSLSNQLLFSTGSTEIDKKGKSALKELAKILNSQANITIMVEGHTDDVPVSNLGQIKDNWDLSVMRSTEVTRFLVKEGGMDPKRIIASGRGEFFPVDPAKTSEARAQNRRTEIIIIPNLENLFGIIKN
ncbi:MAG: OmpA family protein [Bacteroidia bacterium]|nr:OmpA family protein [Bacteroidia bacterium]